MYSSAVRAIIESRWKLSRQFILWNQKYPYYFFVAVYFFYSTVMIKLEQEASAAANNEEDALSEFPTGLKWWLIIWETILIGFSLYFLYAEFRQARKNGFLNYINDIWNYADLIPPILIIIISTIEWFSSGLQSQWRYSLTAIASLLVWLKIFYYQRLDRNTGFFVNMFVGVVREAATFFRLYFLILTAFACSFFIMQIPAEAGELESYGFNPFIV